MPRRITLALAVALLLTVAAVGGVWFARGQNAPTEPAPAGGPAADPAAPPPALAPVGLQIVADGGEGPFELSVGEDLQLQAAVELEDGSVRHDAPITWTSSDPRIAVVGPSGILRARGAGRVIVQAHLAPLDAQARVEIAE